MQNRSLFFSIEKILLTLSLMVFVAISYGQENCGNGIDDDGDGMIDCFDPDCQTNDVPNSALFNTASDGNGGVLAGGANDLNWQISTGSINGPYVPSIVMSNLPGSYYSSPWTDCSWISHSTTGSHSVNTDFFYKIQFELPCQNSCLQTATDTAVFCLQMDFFADNSVDEIYVNGIPQSSAINGVPVAQPYYHVGFNESGMVSASLCSGWVPGTNEMIVKISSGPGYEGFLAQYSTSAIEIDVPEPIGELLVPNVFTPNGDGDNDFFVVSGIDGTKDYNIKIFNRWGNKVYETTDVQSHWDGGNHHEGVYYYILSFTEICKKDPEILTGYITLLK